ncbi:DUF4367 domain-containing protein [Cohnella suwonensis]|uniref:DUF4367 domain-containing protein n=1 Tax=Cohnella suwonensis TaxID=696072 RepID=A0ABW0LXV2_9BACL
MSKAGFEQGFEAAFDAAFETDAGDRDFATPDPSASWRIVQERLAARRRRTGLRSAMTKLGIVAASLLVGALLFGNTDAAKAIDPVYTKIKTYPSGVIAYFFGRDSDEEAAKAKTPPPPDYLEGLTIDRVDGDFVYAIATQQQASRMLSFTAPAFRYVPDGYALHETQLEFANHKEKADYVYYSFMNDQGNFFSVGLRQLPPNSGIGPSISAEGVNVEQIQLSDSAATLTTTDRSSSIELLNKNGLYILISGLLTRDQVIRIYEEMWD